MFLCKDCHIHGDGVCKLEELAQSYGKCENCGSVESCTDCKWHHRVPCEDSINVRT